MGVYQWKQGSFFSGNAQKIGEELEGLPVKTPEAIVRAAKKKRSAMHECFTWDTEEAAKQWNLQEARSLIGSIVTVAEVDGEDISFRAFESVVIGEQRQYVDAIQICNDTDLRAQVMGEINAGIGELARKARVYEHLSPDSFKRLQERLDFAREAATA